MRPIKRKTRWHGIREKKWFLSALVVVLAVYALPPAEIRGAETNQLTPDLLKQVLERREKDEAEIKELKAELAARLSAAAPATNTIAPAPDSRLQQRVEKDEAQLNDLQTRLNENNSAAQKPKYPNLQFHGFGD